MSEPAPLPDAYMSPLLSREHRAAIRTRFTLPLEVRLLNQPAAAPIAITCRDASGSGIGFVSERAFQVDERFIIRFQFAQSTNRLVLCRVCNCYHISGDLYQVGAEFLDNSAQTPGETSIPRPWLSRPIALSA